MTYAEKLKDPRWIECRDRIKKRDGHRCYVCGCSDGLEVHHAYYVAKREPWSYPDDSLTTFCRFCHERHTEHGVDSLFFWERGATAVIVACVDILKRAAK